MSKTKLYLAYGSNLCMAQMAIRCPKAEPVGTTQIRNHRLVFRCVADIASAEGFVVPVGVWRITKDCEAALDQYEGVGSGLYIKARVNLDDGSKALVYAMRSKEILPPNEYYLDVIRQGYRDFGLDEKHLDIAVEHARRHKKASPELIERKERRERKHRAKSQADFSFG